MDNNEEIRNIINRIRQNLIVLSEDFFLLQNNLKQSGAVFNNKVFIDNKNRHINKLARIVKYAQEIFEIHERND